jgi:peptidoglycan DL-endopeptidase LytE
MLDMFLALLLKNPMGDKMRERSLIAVFCAMFLFFGSAAYSATNHKVKSGETLSKIARKHHTTPERLRSLNNLTTDSLRLGQVLTVSQKEKRIGKKHAGLKKLNRTAVEVSEDEQDPEFLEYRVQKGDTVEKLADKFSVDRQDIVDLNAIKKSRLAPGVKLLIPKETEEDTSVDEPVALNNTRPLKCWKNEEERGVLVKVARSFSGAPYKYGGDSVRGLDCSAFVRKMYEIFDVQLPRTAREQFQTGLRIDKGDLTTGDLVFFRTKRFAKQPTHVGIYIGDGKFIHASSVLKRGVKVDSLNEGYFDRTFTGAVRVKTIDKDRSELDNSLRQSATF